MDDWLWVALGWAVPILGLIAWGIIRVMSDEQVFENPDQSRSLSQRIAEVKRGDEDPLGGLKDRRGREAHPTMMSEDRDDEEY